MTFGRLTPAVGVLSGNVGHFLPASLFFLLLTCAFVPPASATTATGTLTVVPSIMNVSVDPPIFSAKTKQTTLSGTVDARVSADPVTGAATALTLSGDNLSMTDMSFSWIGISLNITNMGGYAATTTPPGPVTPGSSGGTFDGSLHRLVINRGAVSGTVSSSFADSPIEGQGTQGAGTGTIAMVPGTASATHRNFLVTIVIPVDFTDVIEGSVTATVRVQGTLTASGPISLPLNEFIAWADGYGLASAPFNAPATPGAAPLGLAWAAGLEPATGVGAITPRIQPGAESLTAILTLPEAGSRAPVWIESTTDLANGPWLPVPAVDVGGGTNPVPPGTLGSVTIQLGNGPRLFIRPRADAP